jgi:hypothetical protein
MVRVLKQIWRQSKPAYTNQCHRTGCIEKPNVISCSMFKWRKNSVSDVLAVRAHQSAKMKLKPWFKRDVAFVIVVANVLEEPCSAAWISNGVLPFLTTLLLTTAVSILMQQSHLTQEIVGCCQRQLRY